MREGWLEGATRLCCCAAATLLLCLGASCGGKTTVQDILPHAGAGGGELGDAGMNAAGVAGTSGRGGASAAGASGALVAGASGTGSVCTPGEARSCTVADGCLGAQICGSDAAWGSCFCGSGGTGGVAGTAGNAGLGGAPSCVTGSFPATSRMSFDTTTQGWKVLYTSAGIGFTPLAVSAVMTTFDATDDSSASVGSGSV